MKKRGLLSWILEFAGRKRAFFGGSVKSEVLLSMKQKDERN